MAPISKASAAQRAGRAGRVRPGHCFRLCTEADFQEKMPATTGECLVGCTAGCKQWVDARGRGIRAELGAGRRTTDLRPPSGRNSRRNCLPSSPARPPPAHARAVPEMQRSDLAATVLQLKALGIDNVMTFEWLAPPPAEVKHTAHGGLGWRAWVGGSQRRHEGGTLAPHSPTHPPACLPNRTHCLSLPSNPTPPTRPPSPPDHDPSAGGAARAGGAGRRRAPGAPAGHPGAALRRAALGLGVPCCAGSAVQLPGCPCLLRPPALLLPCCPSLVPCHHTFPSRTLSYTLASHPTDGGPAAGPGAGPHAAGGLRVRLHRGGVDRGGHAQVGASLARLLTRSLAHLTWEAGGQRWVVPPALTGSN